MLSRLQMAPFTNLQIINRFTDTINKSAQFRAAQQMETGPRASVTEFLLLQTALCPETLLTSYVNPHTHTFYLFLEMRIYRSVLKSSKVFRMNGSPLEV